MLKTIYEDFPQFENVLSIDEVGYGCGAGDLYVTGVILDKDYSNSELKDSKKLSDKKKDKIYGDLMSEKTLKCYTSVVPVSYINAYGMSAAMKFAFLDVVNHFIDQCDAIFIDGVELRGIDINKPTITVVKGDNTYQNIAAASIIAKVKRDRYMILESTKFPNYDLANNKGYLTPKHISGLKEFGSCKIHRTQYVKNFI